MHDGSPNFVRFASLPIEERIADRLADVLFGVDEIMAMLREECGASMRWMEPRVTRMFEDVDELMRKVCD